MGGSQSTAITKVDAKAVNQILAQHTQRASVTGSGTQDITVGGNNNTVCRNSQGQSLQLIASGDFTNEMTASMKNDLSNMIKQASSSTSNLFGLAPSASDSLVNIHNEVDNLFSTSDVQECLGQANIKQSINVAGTGNNVCDNQQQQLGQALATCLGKNSNLVDQLNKIKTQTDNTSTSKNDSLLGSLLGGCPDIGLPGGSSTTCCFAISSILILAVGAYFALEYFSNKHSGGGEDALGVDDYADSGPEGVPNTAAEGEEFDVGSLGSLSSASMSPGLSSLNRISMTGLGA